MTTSSNKDKGEEKIKLKKGDLFVFGMLGQTWLVKKLKGQLRAMIVSADSGWGYWEELEDIEGMTDMKGNGFEFIGNIYDYIIQNK